ncbi:uncharacterized protein DEA37_0008400 [Paragonimus westermani]|uniref:Kazrin N-terminal domain-containing protein n=1 Tax=Paragonimus westermani TaxID=34504 RepID=A0A5J4NPQ1_9TREM|nr:uncharacterized protein DEA37_0008400 [Paragonimus westermani]
MDSDDSYESMSEVFREADTELSSSSASSSQTSVNRNSSEIRELYASTFSGPEPNSSTTDGQIGSLTAKIKEQTTQIHQLKEERIGFLEQITRLYTSLEEKESELVEFMQSYEQKANDVAVYMQEVQGLLLQLATLFPDQLELPSSTSLDQPHDKPAQVEPHDSHKTMCSGNRLQSTNSFQLSEPETQKFRDQRGRALLYALSASVATASARNKEATLPRTTEQSNGSHSTTTKSGHIDTSTVNQKQTPSSLDLLQSAMFYSPTQNDEADEPSSTVCHLPPFCWSPDHVLYWLREYACLPGGCLDAAKRLGLDGKQLTSLSGHKADKLLLLSDEGLQRKFQLALEDLRVHGSPGLSRCPGPSHIHPRWICEVWLRRYLGLTQLIPAFAVRRIDGRLLASLAIQKTVRHKSQHGRAQLISGPCGNTVQADPTHDSPNKPYFMNGANGHETGTAKDNIRGTGRWRGVRRKELCRILLGLGRDTSVGTANAGGDLERAQKECETTDANLLIWTNERVAVWLKSLGLQDFTRGIDGTGLHGAYMVLDPTFDVYRLMKHLHLPANIAAAHKLDEHLQALLKPARQLVGLTSKQPGLFRHRSMSRSKRPTVMQRSITSSNAIHSSAVANQPPPQMSNNDLRVVSSNGPKFARNPAISARLDKLKVAPSDISRPVNGSPSPTSLPDSPRKTPLINLSKRDKRKAVTVSGDLTAGRFARVFTRNRPLVPAPHTQPFSLITKANAPVSCVGHTCEDSDDQSATLGRNPSIHTTTGTVRFPFAVRSVKQNSPSPKHSGVVMASPVRGGVPSSEAPLVDPFCPETARGRLRIMLGQLPRAVNAGSPEQVCPSDLKSMISNMSCPSWRNINCEDCESQIGKSNITDDPSKCSVDSFLPLFSTSRANLQSNVSISSLSLSNCGGSCLQDSLLT